MWHAQGGALAVSAAEREHRPDAAGAAERPLQTGGEALPGGAAAGGAAATGDSAFQDAFAAFAAAQAADSDEEVAAAVAAEAAEAAAQWQVHNSLWSHALRRCRMLTRLPSLQTVLPHCAADTC